MLAELARQLSAVNVGQAEVEHNQVQVLLAGDGQCVVASGRVEHGVTVVAQEVTHELADLALVFDDEDGGYHATAPSFATGKGADRRPASATRAPCNDVRVRDRAAGVRPSSICPPDSGMVYYAS